jgi:hypothetical protein
MSEERVGKYPVAELLEDVIGAHAIRLVHLVMAEEDSYGERRTCSVARSS